MTGFLIVHFQSKVFQELTRLIVKPDSQADCQQEQTWALLQAARVFADVFPSSISRGSIDKALTSSDSSGSCSFHYNALSNTVETLAGEASEADLVLVPDGSWRYGDRLRQDARDMLDLYLPVLGTIAQPCVVIGHLGQSVDARIATSDGDAFFVTGEENRKHLHRLRSLCHAIVVGAGTVAADDPQLTTRAVAGANPVRVIIDPQARIPETVKVLVDGEAPTWLLHADTVDVQSLPSSDTYRRLVVRSVGGRLQPREILDVLAANGLRRIFVEGGGVTVSRFFTARCLTRLQIATAPLLVGEGVPALQIPGALTMKQALRPRFCLYRMGKDVMWDFELDDELWNSTPADTEQHSGDDEPAADLQRLL